MSSKKSNTLSVAAEIFGQNIDGSIRKVPMERIQPATDQPRQNKDIQIIQLSESLKENGLLQPIIVTQVDKLYRIIAGERRYRAAKLLNWREIECRILNTSERERYKLAVIENLQREDLDPFEESLAYKRLKEEYEYTDTRVASLVGKSRNYISELLSIADIPINFKDMLYQVGMQTKNMLIQFSQAVKCGVEDEFLAAYQSGSISSVKSAKEYIQRYKGKSNIPAINSINVDTSDPNMDEVTYTSAHTKNKQIISHNPSYTNTIKERGNDEKVNLDSESISVITSKSAEDIQITIDEGEKSIWIKIQIPNHIKCKVPRNELNAQTIQFINRLFG